MSTKKLFPHELTRNQFIEYLNEFENSSQTCLSLFGVLVKGKAIYDFHISCDHKYCEAVYKDGLDCTKCRISKLGKYDRNELIKYCFGDKSIRGNIIVGARSEKSE